MTFKLRKDVLALIAAEQDKLVTQATEADALADVLRELHDAFQSEYDDKSERWQEGERGEATQQWLDELEVVVSDMEELANTAREQADTLGDLREEPEY